MSERGDVGGLPGRARAHLPRRPSHDEGTAGDDRSEPPVGGRRPRSDPALAQGPRGVAWRCRPSDPAVARPGRLHGDRGRPLPRRLRPCGGWGLRDRLCAVRKRAFGAHRARDARVPRHLGGLPRRRHCPSGLLANARRALRAGHLPVPRLAVRRIYRAGRRRARAETLDGPLNLIYCGQSKSAVSADARERAWASTSPF